ncbi:hypothetical protein Pst134EA_025591 [Puccinia striiformis f. sp. tritici]|uniref:hypothetical protein n=1 Tax=Puccinia striiformis f. sp. tritici TaxID=168172 RepID=UPI002008077E|nr:hypothetical protein Pst134EA_025591 [Puccinia striiformis f. sp. tritici]KAH9451645.1 hypothetical protein Pst134EA_025591 [Puccinia striiformis f. sp. tritici]
MDIDGAPLCRVCRSDDSTLGPLFHPCRCTGSIAHVHQDRLSTWLTHSKKSTCELCGHLFSFEKALQAWITRSSSIHYDHLPSTQGTHLLLPTLPKGYPRRYLLARYCSLTVVWVSNRAYWKAADWFAFGLTSNIDQVSSRSSSNSSTSNAPPPTSTSTSTTNSSTHSPWINNPIPSLHLQPNPIALDIFQVEQVLETQYQTTDRDDLSQDHNAHQANTTVHSPEYNDSINLTPLPPSQNALEEEDSHSQLFAFTSNSPMTPSIFSNSETAWIEVDQKSSHFFILLAPRPPGKSTPGLLELADPGLGMPFDKPHDPTGFQGFSHTGY